MKLIVKTGYDTFAEIVLDDDDPAAVALREAAQPLHLSIAGEPVEP